jgi:uncharacterized protein YbbC (DUF1343 family)
MTGLAADSLFADDSSIIDAGALQNSLYMPSQEALDRVDAIVFDIQDVGSRYYTYPSTLYFVMKACAASGKECIVLDRPNPIGGRIEGNGHREENRSFIGLTLIPIRHGMTLGELALFYNGEYHLFICIMRDVTEEMRQQEKKMEMRLQAVDIANDVAKKQMKIVQDIASLLGETAADTLIAIDRLKETISDD